MLDWLRGVKMVRPSSQPEPELIGELFRSAAGRFTCPACQTIGLSTRGFVEESDEAWGMARPCESCGQAIARERLEVFPQTRLCVACQAGADRGQRDAQDEYCPRCGNVMTLRPRVNQGLARYAMVCPKCRG
jgi:predicted RNA-binding Zn-ribbon protein involved in translation (DUF1610 family)